MSYPQKLDFPEAAGPSQDSNVRKPFASVTNAVKNPLLPTVPQAEWDGVQNRGGPTTDAGHSQTTDTSAASSGAHNDLSKLNVRALPPGLASTRHTTGAADGRSVSSMDTPDDKTGDPAYATANAPFVAHELSHMAPWAQDKLSSLGKK